ncbi:GumC family protein [Rhizobium rosettiformans]|uniref:GumC family protein n=1 Tax=Rhizobium rosettiformans TaxID=1368430 RepID=UPI00286BA7CC|nr:GumC family protein [Rhizobium rosettiformans]
MRQTTRAMGEFDPQHRRTGTQSASSAGGANVSLRRYLGATSETGEERVPRARRPLTMDDIEQRARERFGWDLSRGDDVSEQAPRSDMGQKPVSEERPLAAQPVATEPVAQHADAPLVIDLKFVALAAWRYRTAVLAGAVVCALLGGGMTTLLSKKYSATATLYFDPQKLAVELVENDRATSPEVLNATIDSQTQIITSRSVLETVATNLQLTSDPEFVGRASGDAATDMNRVVSAMQKHILVSRQDGTFIFQVKVTTGEAEKSSEIANSLVAAYLKNSRINAEDSFGSVNTSLVNQLTALSKAVIAAEAEVKAFTSKNDLFAVGGDQIADKRLQSLDDLLVAAQQKIIEAKAQLDTVSKLNINDVLVGDAAASRTLGDLRNQYASLSANVSSLTERLGPRHPQLQSAKASLGDLERQIRLELERMVVAARSAYESAQKEEADLLKELNVQKASQATNSTALIELSELERKAKAARDVYEAVLKRSEETAAEMSLYSSNVRIIAEAFPPQTADGPGRTVLLIAGAFGGGLFGLGLGIVLAAGLALLQRVRGRGTPSHR